VWSVLEEAAVTMGLLTARHVAEHLGLTSETILAWVRDGKLPAFRLPSGQIRFREEDLKMWLEQRSTRVTDSRPKRSAVEQRS
jgi:excisionase family DNA binding protein